MTDFVLTETKAGARVHRAACQRRGSGIPLEDATDEAPGALSVAKSAGCCKPSGWQDAAPAEPEPEPTATLDYVEMAKHFWPQARDGALAIADALGVEATHSNGNRTVTLTGSPDQVARVKFAVLGAWAAAPGAMKDWKQEQLARHRTIPMDDRWLEYYQFLRVFFARYVEDIAA